jgi:hypothetical protein
MPEIDRQLQKLPNFEENIKSLLIPTLNFYLNLSELEVRSNLVRLRRRRERNSVQLHIISMIKIEGIMCSSMSSKWPTMMTMRIIAL